ncbi:MAG: hypothetical protein V4505_14020 [Pseudomonadota bacterium]
MPAFFRPAALYATASAGAVAAALAVALLAGCASPAREPANSTPDAAIARLGKPTGEYPLPNGGRRLQYSEMPGGSHVWNMDYDAGGKLLSVDDGLRYANFDRILLGQWKADDVLHMLGKPQRVDRVYSFNGPVWTYRFNDMNNFRLIYIHIDPAGVVQRILYADELLGPSVPTK